MAIEPKALTAGESQGAGLFEEIMRSMASQLRAEYDAGRITGADYANVYLGSLQSAMQTASQFTLEYELRNQQILLTEEQVTGQQRQNALLQEQVAQVNAQTALSVRQLAVLTSQIAQSDAQTDGIEQQTALAVVNTTNAVKQGNVLDEQTLQLRANTGLASQQTTNAVTQNANLTRQGNKLDSETALLQQKKFTEESQISNTANGQPVEGIVGQQKTLYQRQADGFLRDAEQKAAKIHVDTWLTRQTTDGALAGPAGLDDSSIAATVGKLREGINI